MAKDVVYRYCGILFSHEKEGNFAIRDEPGRHYAKRNKSNREDKYCVILFICGI